MEEVDPSTLTRTIYEESSSCEIFSAQGRQGVDLVAPRLERRARSSLQTITRSSPSLLPSSSFVATSMLSSHVAKFGEILGLWPGLDGPLIPPPSLDQIERTFEVLVSLFSLADL